MESDKIEQMNKNQEMFNEELFIQELSDLVKKHNLKNCVFAGNVKNIDDKMIGLFCIEKYGRGANLIEMVLSFANTARLYQGSREKVLKMMDGK